MDAPTLRRRKVFALALVVGMIASAVGLTGIAPLGFSSVRAADPLISQGKTVTCSSVEGAGTPCAAAVDGNTGTRWSSAFSDPQWIQIDLRSEEHTSELQS